MSVLTIPGAIALTFILKVPISLDSTFVNDNNAALLNSRNPVKSKTQKHLDVYHHITRENQMEFKTINVYRLPTDQMRADLMTKNLPKPTFWRHVINSYNYEPKDYVLNGIHFQI